MAESAISVAPSMTLAQAAEYWKGVSLSDRRADIDAKALAMYGDEERSVAARKKLADNTKNLKKASDQEKLELIGTVLKSYQEEINQLTRRSKFAENAFLTLYKALYEAPDPYPLLAEAANESSARVQLEFELREARQKLVEYDTEFANLKNQEYTIRKLEAENKEYERRMEQAVNELASSNRSELEAETQELRRQMIEQERLLKERVAQAKAELTKALSTHVETQSQLFDATSKAESVEAVTSRETEMLAAELERANLMIASLKQQINTLKAEQLSRPRPTTDSTSSSTIHPSEWEEEMTSLRQQLEATEEKLRDAQATYQEKEATLRSDLARAHAATTTARSDIARLQSQLSELPSRAEYQSLRKQVQLMQEMEFNVLDGEGETITRTPAETMLLQKTRRLESEVTHLKLDLADRTKQFDTVQQQLTHTTQLLHQQQQLAAKLEHDLSHVHVKTSRPTPRNSTSIPSTTTSTLPGITPVHIRIHTMEDVNDDFEDDDDDTTTKSNSSAPPATDGSASMLSIVIGQRDRFREHMEALEKDKSALQQQVESLTTDISRLKSDNLKLYEKLQYVRSYQSRAGNTPSNINQHDLELGRVGSAAGESMTEKKYESLYEEKINPFGEFKKQQRATRYANLSLAEKATLQVGKFLFSKKMGRSFAFFYALTLHLLIMVVLWSHTFYDHCRNGSHKHL